MISALSSLNGIHKYSCTLLIVALVTISHAIPVGKVDYSNSTQTFDNGTLSYRDCIDDRGGGTFRSGDIVPRFGPCEECRCLDGHVVCSMVQCEVKPGCQTIQRPNQCCPDYKCECDHEGKVYNNGERLNSSLTPCQVCYCRGGALMCTLFTCYTRDDCEGRMTPGTCCPNYDHCPPMDLLRKGDDSTRNTKREMQPWFMSSPTQPPFTSSTLAVEANLTTSGYNEHETTDPVPFTNVDYDEELVNTTVSVIDEEIESPTVTEKILFNTTRELENGVIDYSNNSDQNFTLESSTEYFNTTDEPDDLIDNHSTNIIETATKALENGETLRNNIRNSTENANVRLLTDQPAKNQEGLNTLSPTESSNRKFSNVEEQSPTIQTMASSQSHLMSDNQETTTSRLDNVGSNSEPDDLTTSKTEYISGEDRDNETKEYLLRDKPPKLKLTAEETIPNVEFVTPRKETHVSSSLKDPSTELIIEKLTNITTSFMKRSGIGDDHGNLVPRLEQMDNTDILIETNRKLESTEEVLIMDRQDNFQNNDHEYLNNLHNFRLINDSEDRRHTATKTSGHVMKIDVTLPPDIQEEILKLSRILLDNGEKRLTSIDSEQPNKKETVVADENAERIEPIIINKEEANTSVMFEKIVEKRNATSDTNITQVKKEEPEESKNPDSTGGGLDAQTQQDLLTSISDAGKNSEYKLENFELTESDPISTFTDAPEANLEENSTDLIENGYIGAETTEPLIDSNFNYYALVSHDKEFLRLDETTTNSYTSTTEISLEESTHFQTETTSTPAESSVSTTENFAEKSTTLFETPYTTTESMSKTTTDVYYDVTSTDIATSNIESYAETTEPIETNQKPIMNNNEWKIEISTNQKKIVNTDIIIPKDGDEITVISYNKTTFPEMRRSTVRDSSSSEESGSKSDSGESSGNQETPGLLLNDQFPYLALGGFHISTETKSKNKTGNIQTIVDEKSNLLSTNNKIIQQLIKDNQHLIIINQDNPTDSKEEDKIEKFANALAKIINEEPTLSKESNSNFERKNINQNSEGQIEPKFQAIESSPNILDPKTESVFYEETTEYINTETSKNVDLHSEQYESVESKAIQPQEPCSECSGLAVDTGITRSVNIEPIKLTQNDNNEGTDEYGKNLRKPIADSKMAKMIRMNKRNKFFLENQTDFSYNGISKIEETQQVDEAFKRRTVQSNSTPIQDDEAHKVNEESKEFTFQPHHPLFQIKAERIDDQAEGKLFYDSEKFKKPPEIVYPDEYPEEFIYINSPPLLIVTSTVYTSVPDVMFITTQTTNLGLSYDYLTEEYKGEIFAKKTSKNHQKNLKSESKEIPEDIGQKNGILRSQENNEEENSSKIRTLKDVVANPVSLLNVTKEINIDDEKNEMVGQETVSISSKETFENKLTINQTANVNTKELTGEYDNNPTTSVMKIPKNKRKRENQKLLRELSPTATRTFSAHPLKHDPERLPSPASQNNARQKRIEEKDAEWFIPFKPTKELTHSVNNMAENTDAEWIVPQSRRDRPQGRQIPTEENQDAEWITTQIRPNTSNRRVMVDEVEGDGIVPLHERKGRLPKEDDQDAEWITPHGQSSGGGNGNRKKMTDEGSGQWAGTSNRKQGRQLSLDEDRDAEWITPRSPGAEKRIPTNRGGGKMSSTPSEFPIQEVDAEWITTRKTTKS